ncbi:MAG: hypothetical protein ACRD3J_05965 [Thermoanaerobaculia bacterium]
MTIDEFRVTLNAATPPSVVPALLALWHDGRGDWDEAHRVAQDVGGRDGAWVHAYLHRKEGDLDNAGYWYRQANHPVAIDSLEEEWIRLVAAFLP